MRRTGSLLLGAALCVAAGTGCGSDGPEGTDLRTTCAAVREAFPPTLYDDDANRAFGRALEKILAGAEPQAREAFTEVRDALDRVLAAAGDNTAVVTANVELLEALQEANASCRRVDAGPVHPIDS